ncbi:MAG: hypothetical protein KAW56_03560 [Candidatus Marinimicrobia bacterium]|nr:hypothetical protein [Candidatus Neomarinimicrobiota bacterium]
MDNLEYLKAVKDNGLKEHLIKHPDGESSIGYRKTIALEIIAEELIKHNETFGCIVTALENLDTTLNRR